MSSNLSRFATPQQGIKNTFFYCRRAQIAELRKPRETSIILSSLLFLVSIGSSFGQAIWVEERYDPVTGLRTGTIVVRGFFYEIKRFADLRRVDFRNVDLSKAIYGANMFESNLSNADLSGANLRLVNLSGANLTQTNLDDVIRIDPVLDLKIADL